MTGEGRARRQRGFTLLELMLVMAIIALLLTIAAPRYFRSLDRARETSLKANLAVIRDSLDKYYQDQGGYPGTMQDLVAQRYLREIPVDPITDSNQTWVVVMAASGPAFGEGSSASAAPAQGVADVHSGAEGTARDGSAYASW